MDALPVPPERMALMRRGRPLKRWRYVGFYGPELMLCAGDVRIGILRQQFWAVAERGRPLVERTSMRSAGVVMHGRRLAVESGAIRLQLTMDEIEGVAGVHPNGRSGYVWTRKQAGVPMYGSLAIDGRNIELDGEGVIDDTAGYHSRRTSWRWSAGVGRGSGGEHVAWNLVEGVNDEPQGSERAIWVDGSPFEPGPVDFAPDLSAIEFSEGGRLAFDEWPGAVREDRTNAGILRSDYRQPFGVFEGELPRAIRLAEGYGVMEEHSAIW
jgi:Protein of unknown function (DUF2804)